MALVISSATIAQETENPQKPETENEQESSGSGKNVGSIVIGSLLSRCFWR